MKCGYRRGIGHTVQFGGAPGGQSHIMYTTHGGDHTDLIIQYVMHVAVITHMIFTDHTAQRL